ncbi:cytochrome P450 [Clavulina sp. PMI_390]|nr:cytochrome P450 [Clavulina sp. PMI_390]
MICPPNLLYFGSGCCHPRRTCHTRIGLNIRLITAPLDDTTRSVQYMMEFAYSKNRLTWKTIKIGAVAHLPSPLIPPCILVRRALERRKLMELFISVQWPIAILAFIILALALFLQSRATHRGQKLPPGPRGIPWIGQAFQIPMLHSHLYFTELQKTYGDVFTLTAMGQKLIILNSYEAAFELLGKHGAIHCNRVPNPYITRFLGVERAMPLLDADQDWKESRRLYQMMLGKESSRLHYAQDIASRAQGYVLSVIGYGEDKGSEILDKVIHNLILHSTYGLNLQDDDPIVLNAVKGTEIASSAVQPTKYLVNLFPALQYLPAWVPFQPWRTEAMHSRKVLLPMLDIPWQHALSTKV